MLSNDLKQLEATFNAWSEGKPYPTVADWAAFRRDLRLCIGRAMLLELGIDPTVFGVVATALEPGSNVTLFPRERTKRHVEIVDGGAS